MRRSSAILSLLLALSVLAFGRFACGTIASPLVMHRFGANADGALPDTAMIQGADGNFYGTTPMGGAGAVGTIFATTPAGKFSTLYSFTSPDVNGLNADGAAPTALLQASDGSFYGTAGAGGTSGCGTVFRFAPGVGLAVLHHFTGSPGDGSSPQTLLQGSDGNFYGTTRTGGANGDGAVFAMTPAGVVTILYSFTGQTDGSRPGSLIQGRDGNFYGDTPGGFGSGLRGYASSSSGTLFQLTPAGVLTTLQTFPGGVGSVIQGTDGNLYVTTGVAPSNELFAEAIYEVTPAGQAQVLHVFTGPAGGVLEAPLLQGNDGNFYGFRGPGPHQECQVFQLTPGGAVHTLATFGYNETTFVLSGGANPLGGLIQGRDGSFYGTTQLGGLNNEGVVYSLTPSGVTSVLHSFTAIDGQGPNTTLVAGRDGNFYGTTSGLVNGGSGTFFQVTRAGSATLLYKFPNPDVRNTEGAFPTALIAGSDGNFYGTTSQGGRHKSGTFFRMTSTGVLTVLHDFLPLTVAPPSPAPLGFGYPSSLLEGSDGNFYITQMGGDVLKITRAGVATVLHTFTGGADARTPLSLIEGQPGVFYGTTTGTIFKLTSAGVFTTLHTFASLVDLPGYTRSGGAAYAGLTLGRDGNLYGTTSTTVFVITPEGVFTTLNSFAFFGTPNSALIEGRDGNFYGSAIQANGGSVQAAQTTIFQVNRQGAVNNLYTFPTREGASLGAFMQLPQVDQGYPRGYDAPALEQGPDGDLYGTIGGNYTTFAYHGAATAADAPETYGAIFRIPLATVADSPLITSTGPAEGVYGQPFSYQITANQAVSSYSTTYLPKGLSLNPATGLISGVPVYVGVTYNDGEPNPYYGDIVTVTAQTAAGPATETFILNLVLPVSLTTTTPQVTVGSGQVGKFTLSLSNVSGVDLTVNYAITGTAINGVDYQRLTGTARIYRKTNVIKIIPRGDLGGAAKKTVKLTLEPGPGYAVDTTAPVQIELLSGGQ